MPGKGFPPSHKATADKGKNDRSGKRSFSPPQVPTLVGNIAKNKKSQYLDQTKEKS